MGRVQVCAWERATVHVPAARDAWGVPEHAVEDARKNVPLRAGVGVMDLVRGVPDHVAVHVPEIVAKLVPGDAVDVLHHVEMGVVDVPVLVPEDVLTVADLIVLLLVEDVQQAVVSIVARDAEVVMVVPVVRDPVQMHAVMDAADVPEDATLDVQDAMENVWPVATTHADPDVQHTVMEDAAMAVEVQDAPGHAQVVRVDVEPDVQGAAAVQVDVSQIVQQPAVDVPEDAIPLVLRVPDVPDALHLVTDALDVMDVTLHAPGVQDAAAVRGIVIPVAQMDAAVDVQERVKAVLRHARETAKTIAEPVVPQTVTPDV